MNTKKGNTTEKGMDRRAFVKLAAVGPLVAAGAGSAMELTKPKSAQAAAIELLQEHEKIDDIYEISPQYRRFDQIDLLFSNVSPFNAKTNDPKDPD